MTRCGMHLHNLTSAGVWSEEEEQLRISALGMKAVQLALNAFHPRILGESVVLDEWQHHSGGLPKDARGFSFQGDVLYGSKDCSPVRTALGDCQWDKSQGRKTSYQTSWAVQTRSFLPSGPFFPRYSVPSARYMIVMRTCLLLEQTQSFHYMCLQFGIPWCGSKMLFNICRTIPVLMHFLPLLV